MTEKLTRIPQTLLKIGTSRKVRISETEFNEQDAMPKLPYKCSQPRWAECFNAEVETLGTWLSNWPGEEQAKYK